VFVRGAGFRGFDLAGEKPVFDFIPICDGRLDASVSVDVCKRDSTAPYYLASVGDTWYDHDKSMRFMPDSSGYVDINVLPIDIKYKKTVRIPLDFLPARPPKASVITIRTSFSDAHTMNIEIRDAGFGELFPVSDSGVKQEVRLWD